MKGIFIVALFLSLFSSVFTAGASVDFNITHPKVKWKFKTQGPIRGEAVLKNGNIYVGNSDGFVYAINSRDGSLIWKYKTGGAVTGKLNISDSVVYASSRDNKVYAIGLVSGHLKWEFQMGSILPMKDGGWEYFTAAPVLEEGKLFVGSGDGYLYALNSLNGNVLWKFKTSQRIRATPLVFNNTIIQPSNDGYVYVLQIDSGDLLWKFQTDGATIKSSDFGFDRNSIFTQPIIRKNLLIFGSRDSNVYAVDINTHKERWRFSYFPTWAMAISADNDMVYVGWSTNNLTCAIHIETGKEKWNFKSGSQVYTVPLILEEDIIIGSADGKLYSLNKTTGVVHWDYKIGSEIYSSPVMEDNVIFFGADDGCLYALEEGQKTFKAVYFPATLKENDQYLVVDKTIVPYFKDQGFASLDSAGLYKFVSERIQDKAYSVIVFTFPIVPSNIIGHEPKNGMIRKYLETGGKIVWCGDIPNYYVLGSNGYFQRDETVGQELLEVTFKEPNESGNYFSRSTQEGRNWGLPPWLKTTNSTVSGKDVVALAVDEFNRTSMWIKKFNSRTGSGFVSCRTWAWNVPIQNKDLELLCTVALYGLE